MSRIDPQAELAQFSRTVAAIYEAAVDPALWQAALSTAAAFVGGQAAALIGKDRITDRATMFYYCGVQPEFIRTYLETYWRFDTFGITEAMGFEVGEPVTTVDLVPYDDFKLTRLYREWAEPQGWVDSAWVILERSATEFGFFSVLRDASSGRVDDAARRRIAQLAPHLRQASLIGKMLEAVREEARSFSQALEALSTGVIFVDAQGQLRHANAAGRAMLDGGATLRLPGDLAAMVSVGEANGRGIAEVDVVFKRKQPSRPEDERYMAHILPLRGNARIDGAIAALFVRPQRYPLPAVPGLIAQAYALTPMELRVLLAIVEVGGVPEVSAELGVAETTVRTHLARLYAKTGLGRQADLVKLVASFASPVAV